MNMPLRSCAQTSAPLSLCTHSFTLLHLLPAVHPANPCRPRPRKLRQRLRLPQLQWLTATPPAQRRMLLLLQRLLPALRVLRPLQLPRPVLLQLPPDASCASETHAAQGALWASGWPGVCLGATQRPHSTGRGIDAADGLPLFMLGYSQLMPLAVQEC